MLRFFTLIFSLFSIAILVLVRDAELIKALEFTGIDLQREHFFLIADFLIAYGNKIAAAWVILLSLFFIFKILKMGDSAKKNLKASSDTIVARLAGWSWDLNNFARSWIILGKTGSGKSVAGIMNLLISVMGECSVKNGQKPWGGMLLDNKVSLFRSFSKVFKFFGRSKDIKILRTRPGNAPADWKPEFTFNILSYPNIPVVALAKLIIDTGDSVGGGSGEGGSSNFWRTQAIDHIAQAIRFLRCTHTLHKLEGKELANLPEKELAIYEKMPKYSSMKGVYHLIMNIDDLTQYVGLLDEILPLCDNLDKRTLEEFNIATEHFKVTFIKKSETNAELLDNLQSTMQNYLSFFQNRDIQEVFCQEENSFEFESIDDGTFFTIVMPPKYAFERKFIFVFFKLLYFYHGLERGSEENLPDLPNKNLLILWMDEYQEIITAVPGASDFAFAAQAREFRTTMVAATQSIDALISGGIKEDDVKTQLSNMANILCFQASTKRTATMIEETYPEVKKKEVTSISKGRRGDKNTTISIKHEAKYTANELRNLKKYQCAVTHCDETYPKRLMLKPRMPDGSISFFYHWKINPLYWVKKFIQSRKF